MIKRIKIPVKVNNYFRKYLTDDWKFGSFEIVKTNDNYYVYITVNKKQKEKVPLNEFPKYYRIDVGVNFYCTIYEVKVKLSFIKVGFKRYEG